MKVKIGEDEWYPVYYISETDDSNGEVVEINDDEYKNIIEIFDKFENVQEFLRKKYEGEKGG